MITDVGRTLKLEQSGGMVANMLERLAQEQVSARMPIEQRWVEDLIRYEGKYSLTEAARLKELGGCTLYSNITGPKTDTWSARITDVLYPVDDKNWGLSPTPIPDMVTGGSNSIQDQSDLNTGFDGGATLGQDLAPNNPPVSDSQAASTACQKMELLIHDQLVEAGFNAMCRQVIQDTCRFGTGVLKGPVGSLKVPKRWGKAVGGPNHGEYVQGTLPGAHPTFERVALWDFFPDMSATSVRDAEFFFERHIMTATDLRKLAHIPGFNKDAIRKILTESLKMETPSGRYGVDTFGNYTENNRYTVWEYRGGLRQGDAVDISELLGKNALKSVFDKEDPLTDVQVVIWFSGLTILNIGISPLDSGDPVYSVMMFKSSETSLFGYGVPYLLKDTQDARNAAWRMLMDNAALSVGPQIVINKNAVTPQDGVFALAPRKIWMLNAHMTPDINAAFATFSVDAHQQELINIIRLTEEFADREIMLPELASGGSGPHQTTTAQGLSILQNQASVPLRTVVKAWDDLVIVPTIQRCVDWNMQFSTDDSVKGDVKVHAKGSSVLLVRDMHAQTLMGIANAFGAHPVFGPMLKPMDLLRRIANAHQIPADEIVKTDDVIEAERRAAQQNPQPTPEDVKAKMQTDVAQITTAAKIEAVKLDAQARVQVAQMAGEVDARKVDANVQIANMSNDTKLQVSEIVHEGQLQKVHANVALGSADLAHKDKSLAIQTTFAAQASPERRGGMYQG